MKDSEKENLFITFKGVLESIIEEKKQNSNQSDLINNLDARINIGLQFEEEEYFWVNLTGKEGNYEINKGKLNDYDLDVMATPEDLMYYANGTYSLLHMLFKKNPFGVRKLRFKGGTTGRNLGLLLKLPKILVLD